LLNDVIDYVIYKALYEQLCGSDFYEVLSDSAMSRISRFINKAIPGKRNSESPPPPSDPVVNGHKDFAGIDETGSEHGTHRAGGRKRDQTLSLTEQKNARKAARGEKEQQLAEERESEKKLAWAKVISSALRLFISSTFHQDPLRDSYGEFSLNEHQVQQGMIIPCYK
jgi:hypothetical protein